MIRIEDMRSRIVLEPPPQPEAPPAPGALPPGVLSSEDYAALQDLAVCPHWQRLSARGVCVDQWWVGPPASWVTAALATGIIMGAVGFLVVQASKVTKLRPLAHGAKRVLKLPDWAVKAAK